MLRPNVFWRTIWISHGSNFRVREERCSVASTLVLRSDAQDVRKGFYAGEDPDALARSGVGRDRDGSRSRPETTCLVSLHSTWKNPRRGAHRLSVLSRHQFCRGQKSRTE